MKLDPTFSLWAFIFTHFHRFSIPFIVCTFGLGEQTYLIMVVWDHSDPRWTVASPRPHARKTSGRKTSGRKTSGKNKNASEASKPKKQHPRQDNHHGPDPAKKVIEITQHSPLPVSEINPKAWEEVGPRHGLMEVLWGEKRSDGFRYWSMDKFEAWVARYWLELDERQKLCVNIIRALIQNPSQWPDPKKKGQGLERHHLIPVSRGGNPEFPDENDQTWCISLTYGHHLIMHICLATIHVHECNDSLLLSVGYMSWGTGGIDLERIITDAGADETIAQQYTEFRKTRAPMTQETKDKISASMTGHITTQETKDKISASLTGLQRSEEAVQNTALSQSHFNETQQSELVKLVLKFQFRSGRFYLKPMMDSQEFKEAIPINLRNYQKIKSKIKDWPKNQTLWNKFVNEAAASFSPDSPDLAKFALTKLVDVPAAKAARSATNASRPSRPKKSKVVQSLSASHPKKSEELFDESESEEEDDLGESKEEDDFDESEEEDDFDESEEEEDESFEENKHLGPEEEEDSKLPARVSLESKRPRRSSTMNAVYTDKYSDLDQYLEKQEEDMLLPQPSHGLKRSPPTLQEDKENVPPKRTRKTAKRVSYI